MRPNALALAAYFSILPAAAVSYLGPGLRVPLLLSFIAHVSANAHDSILHHGDSKGDLVQHLGHLQHDPQQCVGEPANFVQQKVDELRGLISAVGDSLIALQDEVEISTKPCASLPDGPALADETTIVGDLKRAFEKVVEDLEVWAPVLKETSRGHENIIDGLAMDKLGNALITVCKKYGMKEETARNHWDTLRPPIESAVVLLARRTNSGTVKENWAGWCALALGLYFWVF
ncbi:hypothetical protein C8R46DRAFT_252892 [Mycena filopes]|nr:hypothetical protein C8R46DRAFT_252892 [Mycena filopes]